MRQKKEVEEMATKKQIETWKKILERRRVDVGKLRDAIRKDVDEMSALEKTCDRAADDIQNAIDALSELA